MACALNSDQIKDLYTILYGEINDRIQDKELPKFDIKLFIKSFYNELMDPSDPMEEEKALLYLQAIPDIFMLITGDSEIQDYILDNDIQLNDILKLSKKFESPELTAVREFITVKKKTNKEIKINISQINKSIKKIVLKDPEPGQSATPKIYKNKARVITAASTTPQQAIAANPETLTEEQRNKIDQEKVMFYTVIQNLAYLVTNKTADQQDIEYNNVPVRLKPVVVGAVDQSYFTEKDKVFMKAKPEGIVTFVSDTEGNILFFDEDGQLTDKKSGRPVYQYIRKVTIKNNKLVLSNQSDFYYNIVSPEEQVEQMRKNAERNKIEFTDAYAKTQIQQIKAQQQKDLNNLFNLRNYLTENTNANVLLPITGGSTGYVETDYKVLAETDISQDEITEYFIEDSGDDSGDSYFILTRPKGGMEINSKVFLQRGDITLELAKKIAQVLTTDAKVKGEQLNPYEKMEYAKVFINNRVSKNRINIDVQEKEGLPQLVITIFPTKNDAARNKNGVEITTAQEIEDHLMNAVEWTAKNIKRTETYPANISYNKKYIGGKTFVDYNIVGDKITTSEVSYFDYIKPFIKIEISKDSYAYFAGFNSYLMFAIPDVVKSADTEYEVGFAVDKAQTKAKGKKKETKPVVIQEIKLNNDKIKVTVARKSGYGEATKQAIKSGDGSLAFAIDFDTSAESLVKRESVNYFGVKLDSKSKAPAKLVPTPQGINNIVSNINKFTPGKLFVSGNDISILEKAGYKQEDVDQYMANILKAVSTSQDLVTPITQIITTGQSGVAEAFVKAAAKVNILTTIIAPRGYSFRTLSKNTETGYKDENDKIGFINRFGNTPEALPTEEEVIVDEVIPAPVVRKARKTKVIDKTVEELKAGDAVKIQSAVDSILGAVPTSLLPPKNLERSKGIGSFLDRVFTTKADRKKADDWYEKSDLSDVISLERITAIVNSDAFATWSKSGITLYEGDGGTSVDLYHEAWHGFSQLFLTYDEKVELYTHMRDNYPKWANAEFIDIEESLAEDYRSYAKFNKKFPGIIGKIFAKISKILRKLFTKLTRRDFTRPMDIPMVKAMYDNLLNNDLSKYSPDVNNAMPEFTVLNRAKVITLPKSIENNFKEFSLSESNKINESIDSIMAMTFRNYAKKFNAPAAVDYILTNPTNRKAMYEDVKVKLEIKRQDFVDQLSRVTIENLDREDSNDFLEAMLMEKVDLFNRVLEGFGDIDMSLSGEQKSGVVAYHIKNSRFNILKKALQETEEEDASNISMSQSGREQNDNVKSAKEYASEETMMLLASVNKQTKEYDKDGNPIYVLNSLDIPELEDPDLLWNRLARLLAGSLDPNEMYSIMIKSQDNYPEFEQILTLLPNPVENTDTYKSNSEFDAETKFWQDLKKPIVKFKQLTISKTIVERGGTTIEGTVKKEKSTYESRLSRSDFSTHGIISDWTANFITATKKTNPFIYEKDNDNYLDTDKIMENLSVNGILPNKNSVQFLNALGINLDMTSYQIKSFVNNPKALFNTGFGVNNIFSIVQKVHLASKSKIPAQVIAAEKFKKNPMHYLLNGLPAALRTDPKKDEAVKTKIRLLAELQNEYSDGYSNFSTITPEGNRVWEHFLDSTITRVITSINKAKNWQELTDPETDVNGRFKHMYWLAKENNPYSNFSVLLNSMFYLDPLNAPIDKDGLSMYGNKKAGAELNLNIVAGTQLVTKNSNEKEGKSTSSSDLTTKFLQELHTMLNNGVEEFMRHASKNTAMSLSTNKVETYAGKDNNGLYIDTKLFRPSALSMTGNFGESQAFNIISGYMAGELDRIYRFKANSKNPYLKESEKFKNWAGYNREVVKKDGKVVMAGEVFTAFDDVLTEATKNKLYNIVDEMVAKGESFNLIEYFENNEALRSEIKEQVIEYFNKQTKVNVRRLKKAKYLDPSLYENLTIDDLTVDQVDTMLIKSYTYNSWIHKFETLIIAYGDLAQYNHSKEEFHKRNAGLASGGRGFRADMRAQMFINTNVTDPDKAPGLFQRYYANREGYSVRAYDGTLKTGIIQEKIVKSVYYDEYHDKLVKTYTERLKKNDNIAKEDIESKANEMADTALDEYKKMKEADGQGHITFESYRMLKKLESTWTDEQEALYRKIARGQQVNFEDVVEFFPPYKLQYFGNMQVSGLPLTSFHKFSLAPLIPSVHTMDSNLGKLHDMMMKQQMDYVLFESGSKVGHVTSNGSGDVLYNDDNQTINTDAKFTVNTVFAEFLKNQTEINKVYKKKSIFSTQLRKLILDGLYEQGKIPSTDENKITDPIVKRYINHVSEYTNLLKMELLNEIGFEEKNGEYFPVDKDSTAKVLAMIRANLEKDDVLGDHLIDMIDINEDGSLAYDLSLHPESAKIEKILLSIINKRIIKQKVKGEALVQVSAAMYEGMFETPKMHKGTDADIKKWVGSNFLPTYHEKADGTTAAMKTMVALQGSFVHLLKLEYKGKEIGTIDRLNEAIKDDEWLDTNNNRKLITMVGVRIPVQGLNSMEFMEVYHFLPAEAGNIIIPPSEIVAKSGGDFDIDKMSVFMPNITKEGEYVNRIYADNEAVKREVESVKESGKSAAGVFTAQKAGIENELIEDIRAILELPTNYASLITPNGTFLLKDIADDLAQYVMDYNPLTNMSSDTPNKSVKDKSGKSKSIISPTRVLESEYNLYKHESNVIGKRTLGLGAIENTFNVLMNSLGASMPNTFSHRDELTPRFAHFWLKHNTMMKKTGQLDKNGKEIMEKVISLSNRFDADNTTKIADIFSQMINGWVDVEKDAWIFFIQGNYEVAPTLLYLIKAGVPVKDAIYFVSQPLVREYVDEQRLIKSTYAELLRKQSDLPDKYAAASNVISKHWELPKTLNKGRARYDEAVRLSKKHFKGEEEFSTEEMYDLIKDYKKDPKAADSDLSKLMFMHYLQIEAQIEGITQLKMNSNPDTSTDNALFKSEVTLANLESLETESKLDQDLFKDMLSDSIISSFFNQKMALGISKPLFPLRYHPAISSFLIYLSKTRQLRKDSATTFGEGNEDVLVATFRNDFISYILQNSLRKYKLSDGYKGYKMTDMVPLKMVDQLKFGAHVGLDNGKKVLYVDKVSLRNEFESNAWVEGSDNANSYEKRKLFPLKAGHFMTNKFTNFDEYTRFVAEREFLRDLYPISEYKNTEDFENELVMTKVQKPNMDETEQNRFTYEKFLAHRALENTFNPYHMFKDPNYSFASEYSKILKKYNNLPKEYTVLQRIKVDANDSRTMFNLYLSDKDVNNSKANLYHADLIKLADPNVEKVDNKEDNKMISDFFTRMSMVAFLQTGLNKSKFSFTNIVDFDEFLSVMQQEGQKFVNLLNDSESAEEIITNYYFDIFLNENKFMKGGKPNKDRNRFKNLISKLNFDNLKKVKAPTVASKETTLQYLSQEGVAIFKNNTGKPDHYQNLVNVNSDVVFVANEVVAAIADPSKFFLGESSLVRAAEGMVIKMPTSQLKINDNFQGFTDETFPKIIERFEKRIELIKNILYTSTGEWTGEVVAFSDNGYGDPNKMPQKLFVYLSRRLYEEFGYLNPGSEHYDEISQMVIAQQGIDDQMIIDKFDNETSDPFKC